MADGRIGFFDKERVDAAIGRVCDYFSESGLTLYERWHVCRCIEVSALAMMGEKARDACLESVAGEEG